MLPKSVQAFVKATRTKPVKSIEPKSSPKDRHFPLGEYWRRAIAAMLLSGRVKAKNDGFPNRTDAIRLGKEANFNPYLMEDIGQLFVAGGILKPDRYTSSYGPGEWAEAFWNRDIDGLRKAGRRAFTEFVGPSTGFQVWRPNAAHNARLDDFLTLFAKAFQGLAIPIASLGQTLSDFGRLPATDLQRLAKELSLSLSEEEIRSWENWLDERGQKAMDSALTMCRWVYVDREKSPEWIYLNEDALMLLGLESPPKVPPLVRDFQVLPNLSLLAGADWGPDKLVPLFRYCKVIRIDRVLEFQLSKKHIKALPSKTSASEELQVVLAENKPWPSTVEHFLKGDTKLATGTVQIQLCSALVLPENASVLEAIKSHPRLKNYLEAYPPPGYLLIKSTSDPYNFITRCRELGFQVKPL